MRLNPRTGERGYTLIEMLVVVGIVAMIVTAGIALTLGSRPMEAAAAANQFGSALDATRIAASAYGDGATLFVSPRSGASGFQTAIYAHRPGHPKLFLIKGYPLIVSSASVAETTTLKAPAFAVIIHGTGNVGARASYTVGDPATTPETPCPTGGAFTFVFSVGNEHVTRYLPCALELSQTGPLKTVPPPAAGSTPTPVATQCASDTNCLQTLPPAALTVNPARLDFNVPGDTNPLAWDAAGNSTGNDANGKLIVSEQFYTGAYTIADGDTTGANPCAPAVTFGSSSGTTWTANAAQTIDQCNVTIHDGRGGAVVVSVHVGAPLVVSPTSLTFANGSTSPAQTFTASEQVYTGVFTTTDNCGGAFSYVPTSGGGNGVQSTYGVQPTVNTSQGCAISISDSRSHSQTVSLNTTGGLDQFFVCDPSNPPANAGTILQSSGSNQYISNGLTCASPAPSLTPFPPVASGSAFAGWSVGSNDCTVAHGGQPCKITYYWSPDYGQSPQVTGPYQPIILNLVTTPNSTASALEFSITNVTGSTDGSAPSIRFCSTPWTSNSISWFVCNDTQTWSSGIDPATGNAFAYNSALSNVTQVYAMIASFVRPVGTPNPPASGSDATFDWRIVQL